MIYSRDQWAQLPTRDLYNTNVMMAAVSAAKDMYDKRQKTMEDFYEKYGTFDSPFAKDMERYGNLIQNVTDAVDDMYAQGVDPLRSAEGGAQLSRLIHAFPIAELNRMKANAKYGEQYMSEIAKLRSKGLFNQDYENWLIGQQFGAGTTFENFDSSKGIWNRTAPGEFKTIDDIVEPIVKNLQPIYDAEYSKKMGDGYDYYTVLPNRIASTLGDSLPDILNTDIGRYYMNKALTETGGNPELANNLFRTWMVDRAKDHVRFDRKENPFYKAQYEHRLRMQEASYKDRLSKERQRTTRDSSSTITQNPTTITYTKQRLIKGASAILKNSGVGFDAGMFDYSTFDLDRASSFMQMAQNQNIFDTIGGSLIIPKNAKRVGFGKYQDPNGNLINTKFSYNILDLSFKNPTKAKAFVKRQSSELDPEQFANSYSKKPSDITNHPSAREFNISDIKNIFTEKDLIGRTQGIKVKSNYTVGSSTDTVRTFLNTIMSEGDVSNLVQLPNSIKKIAGIGNIKVYIEGDHSAFNHIEKETGSFRGYPKIKLIDQNGKNLFPDINLYISDGVTTYDNPLVGVDDETNMYFDPSRQDDTRIRYDKNYGDYLGASLYKTYSGEVKDQADAESSIY